MKLRTRLVAFNLGIITIVTSFIVGYLLYYNYNTDKELTIDSITKEAKIVSNEMEAILDDAVSDSKAIAESLELMVSSEGSNRDIANKYLKKVLSKNDSYMYSWAVFEPNAFDGLDGDKLNYPGSDEQGRYIPLWGMSNGEITLMLNTDVENKIYYKIPKETHEFHITEPVAYEVNGEPVTTVSFCQPMFLDGKFIGVAGIDISLSGLKEVSSKVKFFDSGYGRLVNNKGIVLAHPNEDSLNKIGEEIKGEQSNSILSKINNGDSFLERTYLESLAKDVYMVYSPITFEDFDLKWSYSAIVPEDEMMAIAKQLTITMTIFAVIAIVAMACVMYWNSRYVVKSIKALSDLINKLGTLDLTYDENHEVSKFLDRKDETGEITRSLGTMHKNFIELVSQVRESVDKMSNSALDLNSSSEAISMSADEVSRAVEELAKGASEQANDTEKGAYEINELGELVNINKDASVEVVNSSQEVRNLVNQGLKVLEDLIQKTDESGKSTSEIYEVIVNTNNSVEKISSASEMIASIAEQTNLLALNAAIEAARAGEAGKGFAVVAEEIRKLAEQSTNSTKEIDTVVEELISNSAQAVKKMKEVSKIVDHQVQSVGDTEAKYKEISNSINLSNEAIGRMDEITHKMEDKKIKILELVQGLSAIAEENAASTEEVSASIEQQTASIDEVTGNSEKLTIIARELKENVDRFKL